MRAARGTLTKFVGAFAAVLLATTLGPSRGWADIIIDGRNVGDTYTLYDDQELEATYEIVGATTTGVFNHLGGSNELRGTLTIGDTPSGNGTYNLYDDNLESANTIVGNAGMGAFNQYGGSHEIERGGALTIGNQVGGTGTYTLNAGRLSTTTADIGVAGQGNFQQNGGTFAVSNTMTLGGPLGGFGSYTLQGGELTAGTETIGNAGFGNFTQSGGTNVVRSLIMGGSATGTGTGLYTLNAGTLTAGSEIIGNTGFGFFTQNDGLNQTGVMTLGLASPFGTGAYFLAGGSVVADSVIIGQAGNGSFTQTGGTVLARNGITIGSAGGTSFTNPGSFGSYSLLGGSVLANGNVTVGDGGFGSIFQFGGTFTISGGGLVVGNQLKPATDPNQDGNGVYSIGLGSLTADFGIIGQAGTGSFFQSGGTVVFGTGHGDGGDEGGFNGDEQNGALVLGNAASGNGTYDLNPGTVTVGSNGMVIPDLTVNGVEIIGNAGTGTFTQESGAHQVSVLLVLGAERTGNGAYVLSGGTLTLSGPAGDEDANATLVVGGEGTGTFTHNAGDVLLQGLTVGAEQGGTGTYTLNAGTLTLNASAGEGNEIVGLDGTGTFTQNGGTNTILNGNGLLLGVDGTGNGTYTINGGTVNVTGSVVVGGSGSGGDEGDGRGGAGFLTVAGGTLTSGSAYIGNAEDATGTATVTGPGSWTIAAGDLVVGAEGTGAMTITAGGLVSVTSATNRIVIGDDERAAGTITVTDPGSQLLTLGTLIVGEEGQGTLNIRNGGVVTVLGTPPSGRNVRGGDDDDRGPFAAVTIGTQGLVAGDGTLVGSSILNFGTVRPQTVAANGAVSPGTLAFQGSYTQGLTGTLAIEVTPVTGVSSRLTVTGPAALSGRLALAFDPGAYVSGDSYVLLTGNTVSGTFGSVTQTGNIGLLQPQVTYTPLAVDMTLVPVVLTNYARTPNQWRFASYLQRGAQHLTGGDLFNAVSALAQSSPSQAQASLAAMDGSAYASLPMVALDTLHGATAAVFGHLSGTGLAPVGTGFLPSSPAGGSSGWRSGGWGTTAFQGLTGAGPDAPGTLGVPDLGFWAQPLSGSAIGSGDSLASASAQTSGLMMGRDYQLSPHLQIGATLGSWQSGASMSDASGQTAGLTTGLVAAYGQYSWGDWTLDALAGYTSDTVSVTRPLGLLGRTATGNYTTNDMLAALQIARPMQWGGITVAPGLGVDYAQTTLPSITESGADSLNLTLAGGMVTSLRGTAGVRFSSPDDGGNFGWTAYAGYAHEFGTTQFATTATLAGVSGPPFAVTTAMAADSWSAGVGLGWRLWDGADFHMNYDALLSSIQTGQSGSIQLDLHF
ncbi:MAG TPA: autotransporter domain-containing protein [bacterium]|nr:autotransporter domain-containing protein [bacterium]